VHICQNRASRQSIFRYNQLCLIKITEHMHDCRSFPQVSPTIAVFAEDNGSELPLSCAGCRQPDPNGITCQNYFFLSFSSEDLRSKRVPSFPSIWCCARPCPVLDTAAACSANAIDLFKVSFCAIITFEETSNSYAWRSDLVKAMRLHATQPSSFSPIHLITKELRRVHAHSRCCSPMLPS
jgi:hypothetical protein